MLFVCGSVKMGVSLVVLSLFKTGKITAFDNLFTAFDSTYKVNKKRVPVDCVELSFPTTYNYTEII